MAYLRLILILLLLPALPGWEPAAFSGCPENWAKLAAKAHVPAVRLAADAGKAKLLFGGSFDPPTRAHLGLLVSTMSREGLVRADLIPAIPYKATSSVRGVNLRLTKIALRDLPLILEQEGISFRNFRWTRAGEASWTGADGRRYRVKVSSLEYDHEIVSDTAGTLRLSLPGVGNDPRNLFWLAGRDSFDFMIRQAYRVKGEKLEPFNRANWLVAERGAPAELPLELTGNYGREKLGGSEVFRLPSAQAPAVLFLPPDLRTESSTQARAAAAAGDWVRLKELLTPSVVREIERRKLYPPPPAI